MGCGLKPLSRPWVWFVLAFAASFAAAQTRPRLLAVGPAGDNFGQAFESMTEEISGDFELSYGVITNAKGSARKKRREYKKFIAYLEELEPSMLVLMDNFSVDLYYQYQKEFKGKRPFPPAIVAMALIVKEAIQRLENTVGISYEIPASISLRDLRSVISMPLERVGVIYREEFSDFFEEQKRHCRREKIELVGYSIQSAKRRSDSGQTPGLKRVKSRRRQISEGLQHLIEKERVDALWVMNDNALLSKFLIENVWVPRLSEFRKPVVVGVRGLLMVEGFGNFAELPDHYEIGNWISDLALEIRDNEWALPESLRLNRVRQPVSAEKVILIKFARRHLGFKEEQLGEIDHVLE